MPPACNFLDEFPFSYLFISSSFTKRIAKLDKFGINAKEKGRILELFSF
jgi:hypothetical protein